MKSLFDGERDADLAGAGRDWFADALSVAGRCGKGSEEVSYRTSIARSRSKDLHFEEEEEEVVDGISHPECES